MQQNSKFKATRYINIAEIQHKTIYLKITLPTSFIMIWNACFNNIMEKYHVKYHTKTTKKQFQLINKHNYYAQNMSNHVGEFHITSSQSCPIIQKKLSQHGRIIFGSQLLSQQFTCSYHTLIKAIISSYQPQLTIKVGEDLCLDYKIQLGFFSGEINISQLIHIHRQDMSADQTPKIINRKSSQIELHGTSLAREQNFNYCIYILHCCNKKQNNQKKFQWENFVEKFQKKNKHLFYSVSLFCIFQPTILSIKDPVNNFRKFFQHYFHQERLNRIVGDSLRQLQVLQLPMKQISDPAFNEQHIKVNKIPSEYYFKYQHVRKMFNKNDLSENDICRFLISNNFNTDKTINNINIYLNWKENMILKYKLQDFQEIIDKNIWFYLGEDYHGRPVLLNKAANVKIKQLNEELYCLYYQYWLQIYITSKMRGHVSQFLVICDVNDLSFENFKLSITQRNLSQNLLYSPQRQYKLIAINVGVFATYFWNILKPIVPEKTQQKIEIIGDNKQSIYDCLSKEMDIDVIPQYLGGRKQLQSSIIQKLFD